MSEKIKVLVVDDHELIRNGVINLLREEPDIEITGEAESGEEAVNLAALQKPDIILMDISMPGISGLEAAGKIKSKQPGTAIILLTIYKNEEYYIQAAQNGVEGILHKNTSRNELLDAIKKVYKGEKYIGQTFAQLLANHFSKEKAITSDVVFTKREKEILRLLAEGKSNSEIAEMLFISVRTVETHRSNLSQKLGLKGSSALIRYAVENFNQEN